MDITTYMLPLLWVGFGVNAFLSQPNISPDTINLAFDYGPFSYYEVVDDEDRDKIDIGHDGDMGVIYPYYALRPDIEDGEIVIYVNDTLRSRCFIKSHIRVGLWLEYNGNGQVKIEMPYENGLRHGVSKWYDKSTLTSLTIWAVDASYMDIHLYPSGKVKQRSFACGRSQQFREDGQIILLPTDESKTLGWRDCRLVGVEEPLKNGILHGDCFYQTEGLRYDMKFQEGTLETLTIVKRGKVILDKLKIGY